MAAGWKYGRELTQFLVGSYMLVFLGLICRENMQIEGFWFYIASGIFTGLASREGAWGELELEFLD